jgi:hypothetical protein
MVFCDMKKMLSVTPAAYADTKFDSATSLEACGETTRSDHYQAESN